MPDVYDSQTRSRVMSQIRSRNTKPERKVRSLLHSLGFRFRLHRKDLPGTPDIVLPKHHKVIFVHGCFWHQHPGCKLSKRPKSRPEYWERKLDRNVERDKSDIAALEAQGWEVLVIWECQARNQEQLKNTVESFLGKPSQAL